LENVEKTVTKFEERLSAEIGRQEKIDYAENKRKELLGKYIAKILYR